MPELNMDCDIDVHGDVRAALDEQRAVVALESTIIAHGMPYPRNVETALEVEQSVRDCGAVPATIAVLDGRIKAGLSEAEIEYIGQKGTAVTKTSRRDLPFIVMRGDDGATTVAATMIIANMAGIDVMATGGVGGVHRGVEETMDVSADLAELSTISMAIVCAGIKSVLDIGRTLEYLETSGVSVLGYRTDTVPAFYARSSGLPVDYRVESAREVAVALKNKQQMKLAGALLVTNPVPEADAMRRSDIDTIIEQAIRSMNEQSITGKDTTPYLLQKIADETGGRSLDANIALVLNNARLAAQIAAAFCEL